MSLNNSSSNTCIADLNQSSRKGWNMSLESLKVGTTIWLWRLSLDFVKRLWLLPIVESRCPIRIKLGQILKLLLKLRLELFYFGVVFDIEEVEVEWHLPLAEWDCQQEALLLVFCPWCRCDCRRGRSFHSASQYCAFVIPRCAQSRHSVKIRWHAQCGLIIELFICATLKAKSP